MNILHTETLKRWGGQQNRVLSEMVALKRLGHRIVLACNRNSIISKKAKDAGIKVYELDFKKSTYWKTVPALIRIIKWEKIQIVSTHSSTDSWAAGLAAKITGKKFVRFKHNLFPIGNNLLTRFIYSLPDKFVAISEPVRELMIKAGVQLDKITVIPTSVDIKNFNPELYNGLAVRKHFSIPSDALIIGNISGFTKHKAQHILFKAFELVNKRYSCYLLLAGNVSEVNKQKYLSLLTESCSKRVIFTGYREDIPEILSAIDIYVSSSVSEGLSIAVLEAMAMGKAVITSDIPVFKWLIQNEYNGLLFKSEDYEELAQKILYLIENPNFKDQLSKNARKTVLNNFSLQSMVEKTEKIYKELINVK